MAETVIRKHLFGFYCDVLDRLIAYLIVFGFEELSRILPVGVMDDEDVFGFSLERSHALSPEKSSLRLKTRLFFFF